MGLADQPPVIIGPDDSGDSPALVAWAERMYDFENDPWFRSELRAILNRNGVPTKNSDVSTSESMLPQPDFEVEKERGV